MIKIHFKYVFTWYFYTEFTYAITYIFFTQDVLNERGGLYEAVFFKIIIFKKQKDLEQKKRSLSLR